MKYKNLPLFITTAIAIILLLLKNHVVIINPDKAMGSLLMIYTLSWILVSMLQQPLKQSWSTLVNTFRFALTFVKVY